VLAAIEAGQVQAASITKAGHRILFEKNRFGWLGKEPKHNVAPVPSYQDMKIVEKSSKGFAVLLKCEDHALLLTPADLKSRILNAAPTSHVRSHLRKTSDRREFLYGGIAGF
jgi:hypothetical protein